MASWPQGLKPIGRSREPSPSQTSSRRSAGPMPQPRGRAAAGSAAQRTSHPGSAPPARCRGGGRSGRPGRRWSWAVFLSDPDSDHRWHRTVGGRGACLVNRQFSQFSVQRQPIEQVVFRIGAVMQDPSWLHEVWLRGFARGASCLSLNRYCPIPIHSAGAARRPRGIVAGSARAALCSWGLALRCAQSPPLRPQFHCSGKVCVTTQGLRPYGPHPPQPSPGDRRSSC